MKVEMKREHKPLEYGVGAIFVIAIFTGLAVIFYSLNPSAFSFLSALAWVVGPLGIYTLAYSLTGAKDSIYYTMWGVVLVAIAVICGFYYVVPAAVVFGILIIVLAVIGIVAYQRSRR